MKFVNLKNSIILEAVFALNERFSLENMNFKRMKSYETRQAYSVWNAFILDSKVIVLLKRMNLDSQSQTITDWIKFFFTNLKNVVFNRHFPVSADTVKHFHDQRKWNFSSTNTKTLLHASHHRKGERKTVTNSIKTCAQDYHIFKS